MGEAISTLVFRPPKPTPLRPSRYFMIHTDDEGNQIPAFFIKRRGAKVTFLFSHGNAEDLGMMYDRMKEMARVLCVNIMAYDYTGYGKSTGACRVPCEKKCYENIEVVFKYLMEIRGIPPEQIVLYGRSLGSGPTCYLAAKTANEGRSVAGVILHSPFLSIFRVVMDCGVTLVGDMFRNIDRVSQIRCPVLIVHGTDDKVVPFWHSQELLKFLPPQCRASPFFVEGMGHNNIEVYHKHMYIARVTDFLCRYVPARQLDGDVATTAEPVEVPEHERAEVDSMSNLKSRFNPMWLNHGRTLCKRALACPQYPCVKNDHSFQSSQTSGEEELTATSSRQHSYHETESRNDDTSYSRGSNGLDVRASASSYKSLRRGTSSVSTGLISSDSKEVRSWKGS